MMVREAIEQRCFDEYQRAMGRVADEIQLPPHSTFRKMAGRFRGNFYNFYPFLFSSNYPALDSEIVSKLALAGNLYFSYLLVLDELLDGDTQPSSLLVLHTLHEYSMELLFQLFPPDTSFWRYFKKYRVDFLSANDNAKRGLDFQPNWGEESVEDLNRIARNKSSFAKCATAGLMALAGLSADKDPLTETQEHFHLGLQLLDDLQDWKEDYLGHRQSYLLSLCFSDTRLSQSLKNKPNDELGVLGRYIHYSGVSERIFCLAKKSFLDALSSCASFDVPWWSETVEQYVRKVNDLERDFLETQEWLLEKRKKVEEIHRAPLGSCAIMPKSAERLPFAGILVPAAEFLLLEQSHTYIEMQQRMTLPDLLNGQSAESGLNVVSDLFQRTIVLDAFLEMNHLDESMVSPGVISEELSVIRNSRMKSVRGGWNYFPGYPWLPPDTDDLAQVIALLARTGCTDMSPFLDDCIELLTTSNRYADGTFHTWILDASDNSDYQERLRASVGTYWGERLGKDIEVTANLAHALLVYDARRYGEVISGAADAVVRAQADGGYWSSVWYCGPFYGTYVASRLLSECRVGIKPLENAKDFLLHNQLACGGWGGREGDPLSTALAILSLCFAHDSGLVMDSSVITRAVNYLGQAQKLTGSWRQSPFIKMFIGKKDIIYRSETITTAFVVKALAKLAIQLTLADPNADNEHVTVS
jgi:squalene-hopene/tetraprenyl-beta-curcumene cyclase